MQTDDIANQHDDLDTDSLFGSPPPSPGRGRSPSPLPLALPSGQDIAQNVGTLALPGSHLCSELPPVLPPAPVISAVSQPQPHHLAQVRMRPLNKSTSAPPNAKFHPASAPRRKRPSRQPTPVVEPPTIQLPSANEPPPSNFLRNQEALLGRAGLVAGVRPADLSLKRHNRGQSPNNPIIVEDETDQPLIGRRPLSNQFSVNPVSPPSREEIIQALIKQKNLVPILDSLLRVVTGSAQVGQPPVACHEAILASQTSGMTPSTPTLTGCPHHPYPYAYACPYTYPHGHCYPMSRPLGSPSNAQPPTGARISRAPKRRRLSSVPAGAGDWDVPYPFAEGQGPPNYRTNWEKERGRQLVDDLIGLVKSAARKAAAKKVADEARKGDATQEPALPPPDGYPIGSVEYYRERVLRHYRPQAGMCGYASGCNPCAQWNQPYFPSAAPLSKSAVPPSSRARSATIPASRPSLAKDTTVSVEKVTSPSEVHLDVTSSNSDVHAAPLSPASLRRPLCVEERCQSEPPLLSTSVNPLISFAQTPIDSPDNTQANLDDFLSFINNLPAGELDAIFSTDFSNIPNAAEGSDSNIERSILQTSTESQTTEMDSFFGLDPSQFAIDPALLAPPETEGPATEGSYVQPEGAIMAGPARGQAESAPNVVSAAPLTPTLIGSPLSQSDLDPPTPHWDFSFPEPEIVGGPASGASGGSVGEAIAPHDQSKPADGSNERLDKGKRKATEADLMDVDADHTWLTEPVMLSSWQSESTTTSTSVATSRQCTPGPASITPLIPPSIAAHVPAVVPPPTSLQIPPTTPLPRSPYTHHLPSSVDLPPHGVVGSRLPKPTAPSMRSKAVDREDVINRARAMRAQIVGEIERAKVELWETTMESGCLVALSKEQDKLVAPM